MPLDDDVTLLRPPIGFAFGINRDDDLDPAEQRKRLPGLLRFVRTFANQLLEKEFGVTIAGYPDPARGKATDLRIELRDQGEATILARQLLSVLIDLMDLEADHDEASPNNDPDEQEDFHDGILTFIGRLLERFQHFAAATGRMPLLVAEAERGVEEFTETVRRLSR